MTHPLRGAFLSLLVIFSTILPVLSAVFTSGNLVVYRIGDGTGNLVSTGNPVFLDEYSPSGVLVQTIPFPTSANGSQRRLIASGTASTEGLLTRSADGQYLIATGYDATAPTTGLASTSSASVNRVIGRVKHDGEVDTTTALADAPNANNIRSATSLDGSSFWITGGGGGLRYALFGSNASTQLEATNLNLRQTLVFDGQLYVSASAGTFPRLATVGTGTPSTAGQTITSLPGFPLTGSPNSFFLADLSTSVAGLDTAYIADDATGLLKYSLVNGSWTARGSIGTQLDSYRGLTAQVNNSSVTLYLTRKGNEIASLVDNSGYNGTLTGTPSLLVTASSNRAFRGIALAPVPAAALFPPVITGQPANQNIESSSTATLSVVATGNPSPTFQWFAGTSPNTSSPISGATSASYTTPVLTVNTNYWVRVTNSQNQVNSNTATVSMFTGNPNLSAVSMSAGTLSPVFSANTTSYTATVPGYVSEITITPTAVVPNSSITINGASVLSSSPSRAFPLEVGSSNNFSILVGAGDGTRSKTYLVNITRLPFYTQSRRNVIITNAGADWNPAGATLNDMQFINLGLQGIGRVPASMKDPVTGESIGSISDLQISNWTRTQNGSYTGTFHMLPDHGYIGSGVDLGSNYAARINQFNFNFTPYTSNTPTAAQNQIALTFNGSTRFTYDHDGSPGTPPVFTTGLPSTGNGNLFSTTIPVVTEATFQNGNSLAGRLTLHTEGLVLDKRPEKTGSGWISDEEGSTIYHFNSNKLIDGALTVPAALIPHSPTGIINFIADPPTNGRRSNQGFEGLTQSPDGTKLFALLQSATIQDSGSGNSGRSNVRMLVYDISSSDTQINPSQQYVIQLPRVDTDDDNLVDRTAGQSSILALNDHQLLILSRDNLGRGSTGIPRFKSILLADLSLATNIDGTYDAEGSAVAPDGSLTNSITDIRWTEALNIIGKLDQSILEITKFGLNLNAALGDTNTLSEKWEALAIAPAHDPANPTDFFLFIGNDNDFQSSEGVYLRANGSLRAYNSGLSHDSMLLAYRVRIQAPGIAQQVWRSANFGTTATTQNLADTADFDQDGLNNFLEYSLGTNPTTFTPTPWTSGVETIGPDQFLRLSVAKNPSASDLNYIIEVSPDLSPQSWIPATVVSVSPTLLVARDPIKITSASKRFIRLRVTEL